MQTSTLATLAPPMLQTETLNKNKKYKLKKIEEISAISIVSFQDMWIKLPLLEYFEYVQQIKLRLGSRDFNESANLLFAIFVFLLFVYLLFYQISKVCTQLKLILVMLTLNSITETPKNIQNSSSQAPSNDLFSIQHFVLSLFNLLLDSLSQLLHSSWNKQGEWKMVWQEAKFIVLSAMWHGQVQVSHVHHEWISHCRIFLGSPCSWLFQRDTKNSLLLSVNDLLRVWIWELLGGVKHQHVSLHYVLRAFVNISASFKQRRFDNVPSFCGLQVRLMDLHFPQLLTISIYDPNTSCKRLQLDS